ncbi:MAG: lysylphosphatidylglycerol synthase transmembrane domain-containing protein [Saprospiraceae bacterium]
MKDNNTQPLNEEQKDALESIRLSRIILPVVIGIGVVIYLLFREFELEEFDKIPWSFHTFFWIGASIFFLALRHAAYAYRLRVLSDKKFSWLKCIQLIFIWEFSSAVSPTSVGGSAVAFFVLAQEKLSTAKTATIVLYTVVLDTLFFIALLPVLILLMGFEVIHPSMTGFGMLNSWGISFITFYLLMFSYGLIFYYGLFVNPVQMKRLLVGFTKISFLRKWRKGAVELGENMIATSGELKKQSWSYHWKAFLSTSIAWACRFILLNCLIIALVPDISMAIWDQLLLYSRQMSMFILIAFSPTPGGAGIIEYVFGGFLKDFVPSGISPLINFFWRFLTYYLYLLAGVLIIPTWIQSVLKSRKLKKKNSQNN